MANEFERSVAIKVLDGLYEFVRSRINAREKGFDNGSVMSIIKRWDKVGVLLRGVDYHKKVRLYFMSGNLSPVQGKRSKVLLDALGAFLASLNNNGSAEGNFFNRAEKAMLEFVWEYRSAISGKMDVPTSETDFKNKLMEWSSKAVDKAMQERELLTPEEAHA